MLKDVGENPSAEKVKDYVVKTLDGGVSIIYLRHFKVNVAEVIIYCMTMFPIFYYMATIVCAL